MVLRISEFSPLLANRTDAPRGWDPADRGDSGAPPPDAVVTGTAMRARVAATAQPATAADLDPPPLLTPRVYGRAGGFQTA